jgi:hypothetical protein
MHEKQVKILELAGRIQYFTLDHLYQACIYDSPSKSTARGHLRDLKNYGFLTESHHGVSAGFGRLPTLYGLTPKAVRYLVDVESYNVESIKVSKSNKNQDYETKSPRDYFHRVGLLDSVLACLLLLDQKGVKEDFLELYFRLLGMHQPKRTAIELEGGRLEPDAIIRFQSSKKERFYLIEFYQDTTDQDRIKRAIIRHAEAIHSGAPSIAMGINTGHRVLMIFRYEHMARSTIKLMRETPEFSEVGNRFLFKTHESILKDAFDHWATFKGEKVNIY